MNTNAKGKEKKKSKTASRNKNTPSYEPLPHRLPSSKNFRSPFFVFKRMRGGEIIRGWKLLKKPRRNQSFFPWRRRIPLFLRSGKYLAVAVEGSETQTVNDSYIKRFTFSASITRPKILFPSYVKRFPTYFLCTLNISCCDTMSVVILFYFLFVQL